MKTTWWGVFARLVTVVLLAGICLPVGNALAAKGTVRKWRVPIVMEKATVRGKIVVLETRVKERTIIQGLRVQVWTWKENASGKTVPDKLLHETKTDRDGFFSLPVIDNGNYLLVVGDLYLKLTVVAPTIVKQGQQEPKILLILLPKEVI
ncbi:MAG: hypothetical protein ISS31_00725 [Kiritimatiellae bacterium]|nr:hypothetical protein [Kiritimatiellia bacterium]